MRIAILTTYAFSLGNFRSELVIEMKRRGWEVHVIAPDFDKTSLQAARDLGATPHLCKFSRTGLNPIANLLGFVRLCLVLGEVRPQRLFCYFAKAVIFGSIAGWLAGIPRRIAMIEGLGIAYSNVNNHGRFRRRFLRLCLDKMYRLALLCSSSVIFLNEQDVDEFRSRKVIKNNEVSVLGGIGVDLDHWEPVPKSKDRPLTFMFAARLLRHKGVMEFCEAARIVKEKKPESRFVLLGDVDCNPDSLTRNEVIARTAEAGVEWPGHVDVHEWLKECDVFVLPSFYREGVPRSLQEALAMGIALITTNNVGCCDTVTEGSNGFLVPIQDAEAVADRMMRFVEDSNLVETMGKASRRLAEQNFDVIQKVESQMVIIEGGSGNS